MRFALPPEVRHLVHARNQLRARYEHFGLIFTPDGNLVGDLGEAIAAELFELRLAERRGMKGIDGFDGRNRSVQVKASCRGKTFAFTYSETKADILLGLVVELEAEVVEVVYNGPYPPMRLFETVWSGQKSLSIKRLRELGAGVSEEDRLQLCKSAPRAG